MPQLVHYTEITDAEAVALIKDHIAKQKPTPPRDPEFPPGTAVRIDTGCVGVVAFIDDEGCSCVYYLDHDGKIKGPAYGYVLEHLDV